MSLCVCRTARTFPTGRLSRPPSSLRFTATHAKSQRRRSTTRRKSLSISRNARPPVWRALQALKRSSSNHRSERSLSHSLIEILLHRIRNGRPAADENPPQTALTVDEQGLRDDLGFCYRIKLGGGRV